MIKLHTIVGARPQFIKASAVSRAIREHFQNFISENIIHTGQHYDDDMSEVFFREMGIPQPKTNLNIGSGLHGMQTAFMIKGLEDIFITDQPDMVLVYGDTNTTLAAALAASKLHIPIAHVEAGLRSYNKKMPEEINRILTDHCSSLLFAPTPVAVENLLKESIPDTNSKVVMCGDVMYDNAVYFAEMSAEKDKFPQFTPDSFILSTIHRDFNTDNSENLLSILKAFCKITDNSQLKILFPLHPRTRSKLREMETNFLKPYLDEEKIVILPPLSYIEMVNMENKAKMIITDSGGVQKEAYFCHKPAIILREQTEWVEIVEAGAARLTGADSQKIFEAVQHFLSNKITDFPPLYGNADASIIICEHICNYIANR